MAATVKALAYLRTSSASNVGTEKDSDKRQRLAIEAYAKREGIVLAGEYYDAAVSGADPIQSRPGFTALLDHIASNGVRMVLVETASRFARDLMVQEVGYQRLKELGITLVAVDSPTSFVEDTPTAIMVRQILGAVAQFDKAATVAKLKGARDRIKAATGKCEGRIAYADRDGNEGAAREAKRLHRASPLTGKRRSLRKISAELAALGYVTSKGAPLSASMVARLINS